MASGTDLMSLPGNTYESDLKSPDDKQQCELWLEGHSKLQIMTGCFFSPELQYNIYIYKEYIIYMR
jgi:hypothetical protein